MVITKKIVTGHLILLDAHRWPHFAGQDCAQECVALICSMWSRSRK